MTEYFADAPAKITGEKVIATADNGRVCTENNELHVETSERHYIYKHDGKPVGWYEENGETHEVFYLGEGASPTARFENIEIADAEAWDGVRSHDEKPKRGKHRGEE